MIMKETLRTATTLMALAVLTANAAPTGATPRTGSLAWGIKLGAGGRYDDVRMCVATAAGVKGGPAMEGAIFMELRHGQSPAITASAALRRGDTCGQVVPGAPGSSAGTGATGGASSSRGNSNTHRPKGGSCAGGGSGTLGGIRADPSVR